MHTIRVATLADVPYVAAHLRQADRDELSATGWFPSPVDALVASVERSVLRWCALDSAGNPAVLFGCAQDPHAETLGVPWMLGTDYLTTVPKETLRQTRRYVHRMHEHFLSLHQMVDARNYTSVGWMQWLGFQIVRVVPRYGVEQRPFIHFVRHHNV